MKEMRPLSSRWGVALTALTVLGMIACSRSGEGQPVTAAAGAVGADTPAFWVRPGFKVTRVASDLSNARFMEFGPNGDLYMSRPNRGDILTLRRNGDQYKVSGTFIKNKPSAHGMSFYDGWLYFSTTGEIYRSQDTNGDGVADTTGLLLNTDQLGARGGGHWWRPVLVTEKGIFTGIGDGGNINDEYESMRQKLWFFPHGSTERQLWSSGTRNTEKLRIRPGTQEVWGMDHGSDNWGKTLGEKTGTDQPFTDRVPPDEFNHYKEGQFYGHPFVLGNGIPRLEFKDRPDFIELARKTVVPEWNFGAHWAMNGFCFATSRALGDDVQGDAFCAAHGSWNSVVKVGYRIERVLFDRVTGKPYGSLAMVKTLGPNGEVLARPVDCVEEPGGSILFSCDYTNAIYRLERLPAR